MQHLQNHLNNQQYLLIKHKLSALHGLPLARTQTITPRKAQASTQNRSIRQKHENLPQISSPFLKRTVYNMFSQRRLQQLQPFLPQQTHLNEKRQNHQKSKSTTESIKDNQLAISIANQHSLKQKTTSNYQLSSEHLLPQKNPNTNNQAKNIFQVDRFICSNLKKTKSPIQNSKKKANQHTHRISEQNERNQATFKAIASKLQYLRQNESNSQSLSKYKDLGLQKGSYKELRNPGFVARQKRSKEMYQQQRQQIKLVKELVQNSKGVSLSKDLKVKNYAHFFPQIIYIQN